MKTTASEKGRITMPKAVRAKLGIRPGTVLELEAERGRLVGRKAAGRDVIDGYTAPFRWTSRSTTISSARRGR